MAAKQKSLEVLAADDDESIRDILANSLPLYLKRVHVTTAVDGLDAIQKYDERFATKMPYDVVLTDLNMPNMSGADVARHVKQKSPGTLVYVLTGAEANKEYRALQAQLGELSPDGVIQKPFNIEELVVLIEPIQLPLGGTVKNPQERHRPAQY